MKEDLFRKLPTEILSSIFSYELLVPYRKIPPGQREVTYSQGITIIDGKAEHPYPTALFAIDRRTSLLAQTYTWNSNRFILGGDPKSSLDWLTSRPLALTKLIRRLDLLILPYQFTNSKTLEGMEELLATLNERLDLGRVCLSLDGSRLALELSLEIDNHEWLKPFYQTLLPMFQANLDELSKVKDVFVYYPQWASEEFRLEKMIKGESYNSIDRGKMELHFRDQRLIHGWEYGIFIGTRPRKINPDYWTYRAGEGMVADSYDETIERLLREAAADPDNNFDSPA